MAQVSVQHQGRGSSTSVSSAGLLWKQQQREGGVNWGTPGPGRCHGASICSASRHGNMSWRKYLYRIMAGAAVPCVQRQHRRSSISTAGQASGEKEKIRSVHRENVMTSTCTGLRRRLQHQHRQQHWSSRAAALQEQHHTRWMKSENLRKVSVFSPCASLH